MEVTPRYKLLLSKMLGDSVVTKWTDGVDVMTTRAPGVLKNHYYAFCFFQ